jgi:hypothetical protein
LEFLSKTINVDYKIIDLPDKNVRNSPACDMLTLVGTRKVAVEHTSVDSFLSQRRDNRRFMEVLGPLRNELIGKLPAPGHYLAISKKLKVLKIETY